MRRGRPKTKIDWKTVASLCKIHCTISEIAAALDINESTLKMRPDFLTFYESKKELGKMSLRRTQYRLAENNVAMAIWLGKQHLEQKDSPLIDQSKHTHITHIDTVKLQSAPDEELVNTFRNAISPVNTR